MLPVPRPKYALPNAVPEKVVQNRWRINHPCTLLFITILKYRIGGIFRGEKISRFRKNYTQKTKMYMVHTLFLTDSRNFNPTKYTTYTVYLTHILTVYRQHQHQYHPSNHHRQYPRLHHSILQHVLHKY